MNELLTKIELFISSTGPEMHFLLLSSFILLVLFVISKDFFFRLIAVFLIVGLNGITLYMSSYEAPASTYKEIKEKSHCVSEHHDIQKTIKKFYNENDTVINRLEAALIINEYRFCVDEGGVIPNVSAKEKIDIKKELLNLQTP